MKENTYLIVNKDHFRQQLKKQLTIADEILNREILLKPQLEEAQSDFYNWNDYNSELLKQSFNNENNEYKRDYDNINQLFGISIGGMNQMPLNPLDSFKGKFKNKINCLKRIIAKLDLIKSNVSNELIHQSKQNEELLNKNVFIVHGHNTEVKINIARTLEKLKLNPIILHEQINGGKTIIEKFETHSDVGFAIILLTDDDLGKSKLEEMNKPRARQNVILELGYFIGKLGRHKVCTLYSKGVELPSDLYGILYIEIDESEIWRIKLAKELKAAGYEIDINNIA